MSPPATPRHILIDFENVPTVDLAPIAGLEIEVTVLVGEKNKRLDIALVAQLLANGSRSHLLEVGASGRNALDLTLAFHLGKAAAQNPRTEFFIISKDADYDAMIRHVARNGVHVSRHASVSELPFLQKPPASSKPSLTAEHLADYAQKLRKGPAPRDITALRKKIQNDLKKHSDLDVNGVVEWLRKKKILEVHADGKVTILPSS
jgi:hypothetical protein